ncbi:hypothetical protein A3K34_04505 [candidate division WWE3 bacterium RIFOXYC1_FULL_40_10]|uniref:Uncharacterized protein n=1 Tax=candidate division WWE3 bacterium RIFOXYA2_FULL_46_9 TaxID=1802636 RepID=A0A1F4W119_UNCKA|nr:MAG: hypothetical protein A3K58_04505 [candidate division WWE3 bacterium RIFOXYB1_FULL_40_22]OGC62104.1 MAG: hypothetical protein A3K37_04505 [candidate division WWE3 bacterium RIFOXYA1_FULL_40_11]OGC63119.1 MAG: hypothetical protein A2264_00250 [candidate division WWE3 bacterium RIFOXYA2_FULL_46_9]OGC64953.1 MAG: hypothetical protein A2326_02860 [candidate division WWE3 bacterium RIFOXYB2_FULL_41_6]OGC66487.1 MAG: hypothetical protein A3K34_04505 [candidate division WWE3 bacterium RIFOXYC1_
MDKKNILRLIILTAIIGGFWYFWNLINPGGENITPNYKQVNIRDPVVLKTSPEILEDIELDRGAALILKFYLDRDIEDEDISVSIEPPLKFSSRIDRNSTIVVYVAPEYVPVGKNTYKVTLTKTKSYEISVNKIDIMPTIETEFLEGGLYK